MSCITREFTAGSKMKCNMKKEQREKRERIDANGNKCLIVVCEK